MSRDTSKPLWLWIEIPSARSPGRRTIEFRTFRPDSVRLWISNEDDPEEFTRILDEQVTTDKGGFSVQLSDSPRPRTVVGELFSVLPGKPKLSLWRHDNYLKSITQFDRQGGALFGAMLILAVFSCIIGTLNRDVTFFLFCGWLLTSLRVAAINGGWDRAWLNLSISDSAYLGALRLSMAAYGVLTVALFRSLFINSRTSRETRYFFTAAQGALLILFSISPALSQFTFLKIFWTISAVSLGAATTHIVRIMATAPSPVAAWYSAAWGAMILGMLSEIGFQAGLSAMPGWLNSQSASIVSALMMSLALSDKLKSEREQRLKAQSREVQTLKRFEDNYNAMPIGLFGADASGQIKLHNPEFAKIFRPQPSIGAIDAPTLDSLLGKGAFERLTESTCRERLREVEFHTTSQDGSERWFLARVTAQQDTIEGAIQDITVRKIAENKLQKLVDHDHLTGLLNRRGLEVFLSSTIKSTSKASLSAIVQIDLDRFKLFNDLHGHSIGDELIRETAIRISREIPPHGVAARVADTFFVVLPHCTEGSLRELPERLRRAICEAPFEIESKGLNVTGSLGIVVLEPSMSTSDALSAADRACSEAKARGRNCFVKFTERDAALHAHLDELRMLAGLQQHTPTDKFFLEFQPIVALHSPMSSLNYEVLIRMRGDDGKTIPPGRFIGAAERNGLMSQIDRWVLRSTLEWLDDHPDHRERLSFATVNISGASLNDTRFVDEAFAMIAEHPKAATKLCFEITEGVALHDLGSTRRFVDRVRTFGSKLALDDFGAGYTSFNYLKEIPADFIKIDGTFVKDINRNPANYTITRTIVELTHELGMRSIAEWAETPDVISSLCDLGVDYGQGFGLARPMAKEIVTAALSSGSLVRDEPVIALLNDYSGMPPRETSVRSPQMQAG